MYRLASAAVIESSALLVGLAEVQAHLLDRGGNHQQVGRNRLGQDGRGEVLVDHRSHPAQVALFVGHHRNAAAARRDDHVAVLDQVLDDFGFDDANGFRRGHDPAPAAAGVLDHGPFLDAHAVLGLGARVELADGLARLGKGGVIAVHQRLGDDGGDGLLQAPAAELVFEGLLNLVAERALSVGDDGIERDLVEDAARVFAAQQDEADLRAVAVRDDDAVAAFQQVRDMAGGLDHGRILVRHAHVLRVLDERVAADGDDNRLHLEFRAWVRMRLHVRPGARIGEPKKAALRTPPLGPRPGKGKLQPVIPQRCGGWDKDGLRRTGAVEVGHGCPSPGKQVRSAGHETAQANWQVGHVQPIAPVQQREIGDLDR